MIDIKRGVYNYSIVKKYLKDKIPDISDRDINYIMGEIRRQCNIYLMTTSEVIALSKIYNIK